MPDYAFVSDATSEQVRTAVDAAAAALGFGVRWTGQSRAVIDSNSKLGPAASGARAAPVLSLRVQPVGTGTEVIVDLARTGGPFLVALFAGWALGLFMSRERLRRAEDFLRELAIRVPLRNRTDSSEVAGRAAPGYYLPPPPKRRPRK